jgi:phospholipid/cholesterol/gamma-HCH transport system ATP-binding protein
VIEVVNLRKSFGAKQVLRGVSLTVEDGESLVILGGSGTGKSVLLKHILGLFHPDEGHVAVDGKIISQLDRQGLYEVRKSIGMCFQDAALFDSMTVAENIGFALTRHTDMDAAQVRARVEECLHLVGLVGGGELKPSELSGGMKRRVGFARAIALKPRILLFDEPTTGLDPVMTDVIGNIILDLKAELGVTSISITHDLKSAFQIADRIAMLFRGECIAVGAPEAFKADPNPVVQQFLRGDAEGPFLQDPPPPHFRNRPEPSTPGPSTRTAHEA